MVVGTSILLLPLLNPVDVAEKVATLDAICMGKLFFGVGMGYREIEFSAFGTRIEERVQRFVECLTLIKKLWTEDEVEFDGKFYKLPKTKSTLKTVQKPYPPIWIAANNDPAIRRIAEHGDTWLAPPHNTFETLRRQMGIYREALRKVGKHLPRDLPIIKELHLANDADTALKDARPFLEEKYRAYVKWGQDKAVPKSDDFEMSYEDHIAASRFIVTNAEGCIETISKHEKSVGFNRMIFRIQWPSMKQSLALRTVRILGEKVLPYFDERKP